MYFSRGKNRYQKPYTLPDMYKEYIKDKKGPYIIDYKDFVDICTEYAKGMSDYILKGGLFKMPFRLGIVSVISKPTILASLKHSPINWVETVKRGKRVVETNDHTNYTSFQFKWKKIDKKFVLNLEKYQLIFSRANKRALAAKIKSGEYEYFTDIKYY